MSGYVVVKGQTCTSTREMQRQSFVFQPTALRPFCPAGTPQVPVSKGLTSSKKALGALPEAGRSDD